MAIIASIKKQLNITIQKNEPLPLLLKPRPATPQGTESGQALDANIRRTAYKTTSVISQDETAISSLINDSTSQKDSMNISQDETAISSLINDSTSQKDSMKKTQPPGPFVNGYESHINRISKGIKITKLDTHVEKLKQNGKGEEKRSK